MDLFRNEEEAIHRTREEVNLGLNFRHPLIISVVPYTVMGEVVGYHVVNVKPKSPAYYEEWRRKVVKWIRTVNKD